MIYIICHQFFEHDIIMKKLQVTRQKKIFKINEIIDYWNNCCNNGKNTCKKIPICHIELKKHYSWIKKYIILEKKKICEDWEIIIIFSILLNTISMKTDIIEKTIWNEEKMSQKTSCNFKDFYVNYC